MPTIRAAGKTFECAQGANLRQVLLDNDIPLYNGGAKLLNCHGLGTCGTCSVMIEGEVSPMEGKEKLRLSLPPHSPTSGRRLACQVKVLGDLRVSKGEGFFGQESAKAWTPESSPSVS